MDVIERSKKATHMRQPRKYDSDVQHLVTTPDYVVLIRSNLLWNLGTISAMLLEDGGYG